MNACRAGSGGVSSPNSAAKAALRSVSQRRAGAATKPLPNMICSTPPWAASASNISSLMLRMKPGVKRRSDEWEAMTGVFDSSSTSQAARSERCEMSTITPLAFKAATSAAPSGDSPCQRSLSS